MKRGEGLGVPKLPDAGQVDVAPDAVDDDERKIGHMRAGDNLDHGVTVATSAERMAATRFRRRAGLVQFVVTLPIAERDEIVRLGYEGVAADDQRAAGEALRLFITDTLAARSARVAALGRATPFQ